MSPYEFFLCVSTVCRIHIFQGVNVIPLNTCPVCQSNGVLIQPGQEFKFNGK